jgi:hypothetical protein
MDAEVGAISQTPDSLLQIIDAAASMICEKMVRITPHYTLTAQRGFRR